MGDHQSKTENISKISVLNTKIKQLQHEIVSIQESNSTKLKMINKENQNKMKMMRIKYESKLSQSDMHMDQLRDEIVDLKQQIESLQSAETQTSAPFNLDFFNTQNQNEEEEDEDVQDLFKYEPAEHHDHDDDDNHIPISEMKNLSHKQKFLLMKARMAASEEDEDS